MKNLTLRQLRVFVAVARHLSFARAAEEIALSGPAVSMQIRELEEQVGVPLLDRTSRVVSLTRVGEEVRAHAFKVLAAVRDLQDMVASVRALEGGTLDVAMVDTASYFVPRLLAMFRQEHPQVELRLRVASNREQIAHLLQQGEVELAIMGRPPLDAHADAQPFAPNPLVLVTATDHRFTRMQRVPAATLSQEHFIVREPASGTRMALEEYLQAQGSSASSVMQMSSNEAIKQAVMAGMGVSLLPLHTIGMELGQHLLAMPKMEGLPLVRHWHVLNKAEKVLSPAAEAFRGYLLAQGAEFLARNFPQQ
jgi:DNA-binding transcriptional LysR family regulator